MYIITNEIKCIINMFIIDRYRASVKNKRWQVMIFIININTNKFVITNSFKLEGGN